MEMKESWEIKDAKPSPLYTVFMAAMQWVLESSTLLKEGSFPTLVKVGALAILATHLVIILPS